MALSRSKAFSASPTSLESIADTGTASSSKALLESRTAREASRMGSKPIASPPTASPLKTLSPPAPGASPTGSKAGSRADGALALEGALRLADGLSLQGALRFADGLEADRRHADGLALEAALRLADGLGAARRYLPKRSMTTCNS